MAAKQAAVVPERAATAAPIRRFVQRKCACGPGQSGDCAECAKKRFDLQRSPVSEHNRSAPAAVPPLVYDVLRSPGAPLDSATRALMEPRFGSDFSTVRIHTDRKAAESARAVNALAYTVGSHIVFGTGRHSPGTPDGRRLLAHELTHVAQQERVGAQRLGALRIDPDDRLEAQARQAETAGASGVDAVSAGTLQRNPDEPALCGGAWTCAATPCSNPDPGREGDGGVASSWTLNVLVDIEAPTAADVGVRLNFGHTYAEFVDSTGRAYTYGFYPDKSSGTPDPMFHPVVAGCMVHPDTNHRSCVDYTETFALTKPQFDAALSFAQTLCAAPPKYNIQTWNCTTFAVQVADKAGKGLPAVRGRVGSGSLSAEADNPNTLFEGLKRRDVGPTWNLTGDTEIRDAINAADEATIARIPLAERIRIVNRLLDGWVSDDDIAVIRKVYRNTPPAQRAAVKSAIEKRLLDLTDIGQRTQVRVILAGG